MTPSPAAGKGESASLGPGARRVSGVPDQPSAARHEVGQPGSTRSWTLLLAIVRRLPQAALSRLFGRIADLPVPRPLRRPLYGGVARLLGMDLEESERPAADHPTLNALFVRRLRPGLRTWPEDPRVAGSPVDGLVGPHGRVRRGELIQAKGIRYGLADLLGCADAAEALEGGHFLTLYLAPRHYHRIHSPMRGRILRALHVPGRLLPVNPPARRTVAELLPRNERLVCRMTDEQGLGMTIVAVGALNVGRISSAFDPEWNRGTGAGASVTNRARDRSREERAYDPPVKVERGQEIMAFHLGSTVVLLWPEGWSPPAPRLREGLEVRLGEPILAPE